MELGVILNAPSITKVQEKDVIFADAGYKFKSDLQDKNVLLVVGDFDSLKDVPKRENVQKLNVEKDFTDGEEAIIRAKELGATSVSIYGATGGRIDHVFGNFTLLKVAKNLGLKAIIKDQDFDAFLIDKKGEFSVKNGSTLSIFPCGERCAFKRTSGLYYPLNDLELTNQDTRGISNKTTSDKVEYEINFGEALVIINK